MLQVADNVYIDNMTHNAETKDQNLRAFKPWSLQNKGKIYPCDTPRCNNVSRTLWRNVKKGRSILSTCFA